MRQARRQLSNEARAAVAEYFSVYKGTDASGLVKRVNVSTAPPSLERAQGPEQVLEDTYLPEQQLLEDDKYAEPVLAMIPVADVQEDVAAAWKRRPRTTRCKTGRPRVARGQGEEGGQGRTRQVGSGQVRERDHLPRLLSWTWRCLST